MFKQLIRAVRNSKLVKAILWRKEIQYQLNSINGEEHPWQRDLDHLAQKLGEDEVSIPVNQEDTLTKVAESTVVEKDFQNLFNEVKSEMQQKNSGTKSPVVTRKTREADITAVDLKSWWGQSVATWDPIDSKNVDSVNQQPKRQRTKWFDG